MKKIFLILLCLAGFIATQAQDVKSTITSKDTVKVSGCELTTYTSKSGNEYTKVLYMGRKLSISKKDIENFDKNKTYIIYNVYNTGERKISKVIIK